MLSAATRATWPLHKCSTSLRTKRTTFSTRKFICSLLSGIDLAPFTEQSPTCADYAFSGTLEYANCSLGAIVWVSCEGDLMTPGYYYSQQTQQGYECVTEQLNFTKRELILECSACRLSLVGLNTPCAQLYWYPTKLKTCPKS